MKNLSKEDFWDKVEVDFPEAFKDFQHWIDEFKVSVNWDVVFNGNIPIAKWDGRDGYVSEENTKAPKFHDLPIEFQVGILTLYFGDTGLMPPITSMEHLPMATRTMFEFIHNRKTNADA